MLYFFRRGSSAKSCETRLQPNGHGFQLAITEAGFELIEEFQALEDLLSRKHRLLQEWRADGWEETPGKGLPPAPDDWAGP